MYMKACLQTNGRVAVNPYHRNARKGCVVEGSGRYNGVVDLVDSDTERGDLRGHVMNVSRETKKTKKTKKLVYSRHMYTVQETVNAQVKLRETSETRRSRPGAFRARDVFPHTRLRRVKALPAALPTSLRHMSRVCSWRSFYSTTDTQGLQCSH